MTNLLTDKLPNDLIFLCLDSLPLEIVIHVFMLCGASVSMTFCSENMPIMVSFDFYRSISVPPLSSIDPSIFLLSLVHP